MHAIPSVTIIQGDALEHGWPLLQPLAARLGHRRKLVLEIQRRALLVVAERAPQIP